MDKNQYRQQIKNTHTHSTYTQTDRTRNTGLDINLEGQKLSTLLVNRIFTILLRNTHHDTRNFEIRIFIVSYGIPIKKHIFTVTV